MVMFFVADIHQHCGHSVMLFLLTLLAPIELAAHRLDMRGYELVSSMSLQCKETDWQAGMLNISCTFAAIREPIYNFGFVIHEDTCLVCRLSGTPGEENVIEVSFTGSLYVEGEKYQLSSMKVPVV